MTENVFFYLHARDVYTLYFPCFVCKIPRRFNCCQNGHQEPYERGSPLRKEKSRAGWADETGSDDRKFCTRQKDAANLGGRASRGRYVMRNEERSGGEGECAAQTENGV